MIILKWRKQTNDTWVTNFKGHKIESLSPKSFKINQDFQYNGNLLNLLTIIETGKYGSVRS